MIKVAIVSGLLPSGHYTENLCLGLNKIKKIKVSIYTDKDPNNLKVKKCGKIRLVWSKTPLYIFQILAQLMKDQPDIVHLQHEINMFGSLSTAILFPFLILFARMGGARVVTTVHATVKQSQIDDNFVRTFNKNPKYIKPVYLKLFFKYLYRSICVLSNSCVVHTKTAKKVLSSYSRTSTQKIIVIPTAIPYVKQLNLKKKNYFLYFGYIARRKGLESLIKGFRKFCLRNPQSRFNLWLAGGVIKGQEESLRELKKIIADSKLGHKVKYLGFLERSKQKKLYRESYGVVIPAKISISASGPLYHAFSHGKFIIASKIGHLKDEIKNNYNGVLTQNNKWFSAFEKAIKNPHWVKQIEQNAQKTAKQRSPKLTAFKYLNLYQSLDT